MKTLAARREDGPAMNAALAGTARLALVYCLLFADRPRLLTDRPQGLVCDGRG